MSVQIELSDEQASLLESKAAAEGLTLQEWLLKLAGEESNCKTSRTGYGMLAKYGPAPSVEEIEENRREMFGGFAKDF